MCNFEQIAALSGCRLTEPSEAVAAQDGPVVQEGVMSEADQFRAYAQEALTWAGQCAIEKEKRTLLELARTWSLAADASATSGPEPNHANQAASDSSKSDGTASA
jgi:hypothetical protein